MTDQLLPQYWVSSATTLGTRPLCRVFCVGVANVDGRFYVVATDEVNTNLHWSVGVTKADSWDKPFEEWVPPFQASTVGVDFVSTPFVPSFPLSELQELSGWFETFREREGLATCNFVIFKWFTALPKIRSIIFVLHQAKLNKWIKAPTGGNFIVDVAALEADERESTALREWEHVVSDPLTPDVSAQWSIVFNQRRFLLKAKVFIKSDRAKLEFLSTCPHALLLHWGTCEQPSDADWKRLSTKMLIDNEWKPIVIDAKAMQTPFTFVSPQTSLQICKVDIRGGGVPKCLAFVLKEQQAQNWYSNGNSNFVIALPQHPQWEEEKKLAMEEAEKEETARLARRAAEAKVWQEKLESFQAGRPAREEKAIISFNTVPISEDLGEVDVSVYPVGETKIIVEMLACLRTACILHWGCVGIGGENRRRLIGDWQCPPAHLHPAGTIVADAKRAVQTPLVATENVFLYTLQIEFPATPKAKASEHDTGFKAEFGAVSFVLKEADSSRWFKARDGKDVMIRLETSATAKWGGSQKALVDKIVEAEVEWDHMTLMHRYHLVTGAMDENFQKAKSVTTAKDIASQHDFWSWIYVWNRFSQLCWLDWQRRYNTQPRDLAHASEVLSCKVASFWRQLPLYRPWLRMTLSTMGRGGSAGQAIRDRILDIMHKHKIPETQSNFYEQWHQKLHNNTTPDDVPICASVIKFLETGGNIHEYWNVLHSYGITKEKLASYERPIRLEPFMVHCDIGSLIWDLRQYLDILKEVHDALDLQKSAARVRHLLDGHLQGDLDSILHEVSHGHAGDFEATKNLVLRICHLRRGIMHVLNRDANDWATRDLLLLDFSLEAVSSAQLQTTSKGHSSPEAWMLLLGAFISLWSLHDPTNKEWMALSADWNEIGLKAIRTAFTGNVREDALMCKALIDRLTRAVGDTTDLYQSKMGPASEYLGLQVEVDPTKINTFVDEVIRGSSLFAVSMGVKHIEPLIRQAAQLPPWQLISWVTQTKGQLVSVKELRNIQDKVFTTPTILISDAVSGEEEIPTGVQAVLVRSAAAAPDILSHVAVRARNAHVLLAVCFDSAIVTAWEQEYQNCWVELEVTQGGSSLSIKPYEGVDVIEEGLPELKVKRRASLSRADSRRLSETFDRSLTQSKLDTLTATSKLLRSNSIRAPVDLHDCSKHFIIPMDNFTSDLVGTKSMNLQRLKEKLSKMLTPRAFALPYGSLQKTLCSPENEDLLPQIKEALAGLSLGLQNSEVAEIFENVQRLMLQIRRPADYENCLNTLWNVIDKEDAHKVSAGIVRSSLQKLHVDSGDDKCWQAIRLVWASLFAMRPWVSLAKAERSFMDLNMAVLVQELMPADFAFVLHSRNPFSENTDKATREMYGEIVVGLGEVLVANYPGRAMSWTMRDNAPVELIAFPAKSQALMPSATLIFRSDSNGEDLEGFAGAGLFESVPAISPALTTVTYKDSRLVYDHAWRKELLGLIGKIAFDIEDAFEAPMDIEGVVCGDKVVIVQARPQV